MKNIIDFTKFIKENSNESDVVSYSFSFPLKKKYEIKDDGYWTWDELCDFLKQNGTDLKSDVESEMELEEGEEREVTDEDLDNYVNNYRNRSGRRGSSWQSFKSDYGLEFEDNDLSSSDYRDMMNDFNEANLEQYFDSDSSYWVPFKLANLKLVEPIRRGFYGVAEGKFDTDVELNEDQLKCVKDFISGQCSDGWGEGFEQQDRDEDICGLRFTTTIHPWFQNNWNLTIKKL